MNAGSSAQRKRSGGILDGTITELRRVVKPQPQTIDGEFMHHVSGPKWETGRPYVCPFGVPGDRLWVKETFCHPWFGVDDTLYRADITPQNFACKEPFWSPSVRMPRNLSRIDLVNTAVRVERGKDGWEWVIGIRRDHAE